MIFTKYIQIILFFGLTLGIANSSSIGNENNNRFVSQLIKSTNSEPIDEDGKVILGWTVDVQTNTITFEIEAHTTGYIGFGISPQGSMLGADIFICGVFPNGSAYAQDRYGIGFQEPKIDEQQDWLLLEAIELLELGITYARFSRLLDTCDEEDYPIGTDTTRVIWAMGSSDDVNYHGSINRGVHSMNLVGEPTPEVDFNDVRSWNMTLDMEMPSLDTSYWCSFHKAPVLEKKHHIIAFDAYLDGALAKKHTHHFILHNCYVPSDSDQTADEFFGRFSVNEGFMGGHCYDPNETTEPLPIQHCEEYLYVWAKGGKMMSFPLNVGYPIGDGDNAGKQIYHMLEIHYDNPEKVSGLQFNAGVQYYYSEMLREEDAGLLQVVHEPSEVLTIPGAMEDFLIIGHCHPDCSRKYFPSNGITIFNSLLHSHISGRKLKVRHFRENIELPWIDYDDHYDFDYQQNKPLKNTQLMPGDQFTVECNFNSKWNSGKVVVGGLSIREEMCQAYLWYYPRMEMTLCGSTFPMGEHFMNFGITSYHKEDSLLSNVLVIDEPEYLKGPYPVSINNFNWSSLFIEYYRDSRRNGVHTGYCGVNLNDVLITEVKYPEDLIEYIEEDHCDVDPPTTPPTGDGNCTQDGVYYVAYPGDCSKYMICSNHILLPNVMQCAPGTLFDPLLGDCNLETLVDCVPNCPDDGLSYIPHDKECSKYWLCTFGEPTLKICPDGLVFDPKLDTCNLEDQVFCPNLCPPDAININLPHSNNCSMYWLCIYGEPTLRQCAPGMLFDPELGLCNTEDQVDCLSPLDEIFIEEY